jgi:plasmid stabilization system protein ParE
MYEYRLTSAAEEDLIGIAQYDDENFGIEQSDRYRDQLKARFSALAAHPMCYPAVEHIREGYRRTLCRACHCRTGRSLQLIKTARPIRARTNARRRILRDRRRHFDFKGRTAMFAALGCGCVFTSGGKEKGGKEKGGKEKGGASGKGFQGGEEKIRAARKACGRLIACDRLI